MPEPTQEEKQEFWKRFGFKYVDITGIEDLIDEGDELNWESPDGEIYEELPPIDPNSLFRWAVPELFKRGFDYKLWSDDGYHFAHIFPIVDHQDIVAASIVGELKAEDALFSAFQCFIEEVGK